MKKALGVGLATIAAVALSACELDTTTVVNADGTGTYSVVYQANMAETAAALGVPENQVVETLTQAIDEGFAAADQSLVEIFDYAVVDAGDNVAASLDSYFTYDTNGWSFPGADDAPTGVTVTLDESGETATLLFDPADHNPFLDVGEGATELSFTVTFPGPVTNVTGEPIIQGNTVTWETAQLEGTDLIGATGSLGGATVPQPPGEDPGFPEPEVTDTPESQETPSPEPDVTETAQPEEDDDRTDRDDDRPAVADQGSDFPWSTILLIGLLLFGLTGITIAVIFLIRGKRASEDSDDSAQ